MGKLKLMAIKTDNGYYITDNINDDKYYGTEIKELMFDGEEAKPTFYKGWFLIKEIPKEVGREKHKPYINERFELSDPKTFLKFKKVYNAKDVVIEKECADNDYKRKYTKEFEKIVGLYEYKYEMGEMIYEPIEFEFEVLAEMKQIPDREPFEYEVFRTKWEHKGTTIFDNYSENGNVVIHNILDKIVIPPILLHTKPCETSSHVAYKIIRFFVKQHIDPDVAVITSDYDFCFTVEKIIKLAENEEYTIDKNMFKKRAKPKYVTRYRNNRKVKIFEMTYSPYCYEEYTPIKGFQGKNEKDLKNNVDKYLKDLITKINEPLVECSHCKGLGVILQEKGGKSNEK